MDNFNFYSPTEFVFGRGRENETGKGAKEEDIPVLVKNQGVGSGGTGGFVSLSEEDIAKIYRIAAKAEV